MLNGVGMGRRAARVCSLVGGLWLAMAAVCPSAEANHLKVYTPQTEAQGELEFSYWLDYFADTNLPFSGLSVPRDKLFRHTVEVEYGVNDHWTVALYGDWEGAHGDALQYVQTRFESIYQLFEPGERFLNAAVYVEYAVPHHNYAAHDELELKLVLQKEIGQRLLFSLNPVVEQDINGDEGFELGYESGLYYRLPKGMTPGIELFGLFGPIREFDPRREQRHSIGPGIKLKMGQLVGEIGVQFGLTHGSDRVVVKSIISYELEPK